MLYSYFFNMLKVGVPGFTQVPQLLVYNLFTVTVNGSGSNLLRHLMYQRLTKIPTEKFFKKNKGK